MFVGTIYYIYTNICICFILAVHRCVFTERSAKIIYNHITVSAASAVHARALLDDNAPCKRLRRGRRRDDVTIQSEAPSAR